MPETRERPRRLRESLAISKNINNLIPKTTKPLGILVIAEGQFLFFMSDCDSRHFARFSLGISVKKTIFEGKMKKVVEKFGRLKKKLLSLQNHKL